MKDWAARMMIQFGALLNPKADSLSHKTWIFPTCENSVPVITTDCSYCAYTIHPENN